MARRFLEGVPLTWWGKCAAAGFAGGIAMALWEMTASLAMGSGFWMPMNLIAATLPAYRPTGPEFAAGASLTGLALHLLTSIAWGLIYGVIAGLVVPSEARKLDTAALIGTFFGTGVWVVMGLGIGPWFDPTVRAADPIVFAIGHLIYGLVTALLVAVWARDSELRYLSVTFGPEEIEKLTEERTAR